MFFNDECCERYIRSLVQTSIWEIFNPKNLDIEDDKNFIIPRKLIDITVDTSYISQCTI